MKTVKEDTLAIISGFVIIFMWWLGTKVLKIDNKPMVITLVPLPAARRLTSRWSCPSPSSSPS